VENSFFSNALHFNTKDKPRLFEAIHNSKINFLFKMLENFNKEGLALIKEDKYFKSEQELFIDYLKLAVKLFEENVFLEDNPFTSSEAYKAFEIGIAKYGIDKIEIISKKLKESNDINDFEFTMFDLSVPYALEL
jgi:hypothetical protein